MRKRIYRVLCGRIRLPALNENVQKCSIGGHSGDLTNGHLLNNRRPQGAPFPEELGAIERGNTNYDFCADEDGSASENGQERLGDPLADTDREIAAGVTIVTDAALR